jgi:Leucine-rich repeat (LRR) protein
MKSNGIPANLADCDQVTGLVYKVKASEKNLDLTTWSRLSELIVHNITDQLDILLPKDLKKLTLIAPKAQTQKLSRLINSCQQLEILTLKEAGLDAFFEIPQLSHLHSLSIISSRLRTLDPKIEYCQKLESLNLSGNLLVELPVELAKLQTLKRVILDGNRLETLPSAIFALHNLQHLGIDQNSFSRDEKARILETFGITPL